MLPRHKRFLGILATLIGVTAAIYLILTSFQDNLLYYLTPIKEQLGLTLLLLMVFKSFRPMLMVSTLES